MTKRNSILALALVASFAASPALAQNYSERVISWLEQHGYTKFEVKRTWLGRVKIEAYAKGVEREIIINGRTGEILRDFWYVESEHRDNASVSMLPAPSEIGNARGVVPTQVAEGASGSDSDHEEGSDHDDDHSTSGPIVTDSSSGSHDNQSKPVDVDHSEKDVDHSEKDADKDDKDDDDDDDKDDKDDDDDDDKDDKDDDEGDDNDDGDDD